MTRKEQDQVTHLQDTLNRRAFLKASAHGFGAAALASLLGAEQASARPLFAQPQHPARAKRVIYLFQSGGPSQMDLFDPKPQIEKERGKELPPSVRGQQRITGMTSKQSSLGSRPSTLRSSIVDAGPALRPASKLKFATAKTSTMSESR